ncbi:hypothetical protein RhiJN_22288 [Ceratobasidium sp. AG-Ba]|nr:hypothetical protein RhiJN_22288 [Ceratobasidium sp. AG-Ba]
MPPASHGNIAMIKGITKGYHGINGIVFAARGVPLEHFLSRVNTGSALVRCVRGLKEALLHDPMGPSERFDAGNKVIVESNGQAAVCFAVTDTGWIFPGVIFQGILRKLASIESPVALLASDLIATSHAYGTSKENQILESIAALGLMRFTEIEIMRIAIEYRMRPTYMVLCSWVSNNEHPLFTIKPGDIGVVVESASVNPVPCWYLAWAKRSAWNLVHQGTSVPGVEYHDAGRFKYYTSDGDIISESVHFDFTASHGWISRQLPLSDEETLVLMSHRESLSCYNENEIKSRLVEHRLLERVDALYYCFAAKSKVVIKDLRSNQADRDPLYFHFKPSSRSTLREFWGFVSTSSDPLANTGIEKAEVDITYRIEYETCPLSEMWSLKYERTMRAGLASIPGGYPGAYIEEF